MSDIPPFIIKHPELVIKAAVPPATLPATDVVIRCQGHAIAVEPDQDENSFETFCGTYTSYGPEKWTITLSCYTSYGTEGLWTLLRPLCGLIVAFELLPDGDVAASVDNPIMSGSAVVKAFPFLSGDVSDASDVDVEFAVQGAAVFGIAPPAGDETRAASKPAEKTPA